jgi:hypothetical protein
VQQRPRVPAQRGHVGGAVAGRAGAGG